MAKRYNHGAVLKVTREDTRETIEKNFELMRGCGLNTVVIWPAAFWWEEKREGYPFNTGKMILELAEKHGIEVIMELAGQLTTLEYLPDFMMKPEYYPVDENGNKLFGQSSFGFMNYFHPEVKEIITEHYKKCAMAYKDYPALIGYDVFNETMFRSQDEYTLNDFREWLKDKYGTIEKLNQVWERTFADFSDINRETWKWMSVMPEADFCIWRREAVARFLKPWCDAILSVDDKHALIADNIHSQVSLFEAYDRPQGDYSLKSVVDTIGMSFYPKQQTGLMPTELRWEVFDGFASAARWEGFYVFEMQTHIQALFNPGTCVLLSELKHWCYEAYAAGAKALIYWMWRPFTKGLQTLGRGLVNYRTIPTERYYLVKEISEDFDKYGVIRPVKSKVGVLFHEFSDDLARRFTISYAVDKNFYNKSLFGAYKALVDINVRPDIVTIDDISAYDVLVVTNACAMSQSDVNKLKDYVRGGGKLILDGKVAVVDGESLQYEYIPGGGLHELAGEIYFETDDKYTSFTIGGKTVDTYYGRDVFELTDGEAIATFPDGLPAVVKKKYGDGEVISYNMHLFYAYLERGYSSILDHVRDMACAMDLPQLKTDAPFFVRLAENDEKYLVFVFNYTDAQASGEVEVSIGDLNTTVSVTVPAKDVKIVEIDK